jgi:hypothetical protein
MECVESRLLLHGGAGQDFFRDYCACAAIPDLEATLALLPSFRVARPHLEPDRGASKAEGFADLAFQEALDAGVALYLAAGAENEGKRDD